MVAHVLRLRLDILAGAMRPGARHMGRSVAGIVVVIVVVGALAWAILRLRDAPTAVATAVTVLIGTAVVLGFLVAPPLAAIDDPLDPRRFAVLGLAPWPLTATLLLASVVSLTAVALAVLGVCLVLMWQAHGVSVGVAATAVVAGILTCALAGKIGLALMAIVLPQRRSRELTGVFLVALLIVVVPLVVLLASFEWGERVPPQLTGTVAALAVSPLGAAWAAPGLSASGGAGLALVIALLTVAAMAVVWALLVRRLLTTIDRPTSSRDHRGLGWFALLPGTPTGAIAARSLVYWLRDPRYLVNIAVIPVASVVAATPLLVVGVPLSVAALVPVPLMALFFGWLAHNDLAYDSTALWMHISSAVRGAADRAGRLVPVVLITVPLLAVAIPVATALHGDATALPALMGVCAALFLSGMGLSSLASALAPYAVSGPGDSPFQQPQRTGGGLAQAAVLLGGIAVSAPALWWGWLALTTDASYGTAALWGGLAIGVVVLVAGVGLGGVAFTRRSSRLMEFAEAT